MRRSLEGVEGVIEAEVSFKERKALIVVGPNVTDEDLNAAVARSGRFKGKVLSRLPVEDGSGAAE